MDQPPLVHVAQGGAQLAAVAPYAPLGLQLQVRRLPQTPWVLGVLAHNTIPQCALTLLHQHEDLELTVGLPAPGARTVIHHNVVMVKFPG